MLGKTSEVTEISRRSAIRLPAYPAFSWGLPRSASWPLAVDHRPDAPIARDQTMCAVIPREIALNLQVVPMYAVIHVAKSRYQADWRLDARKNGRTNCLRLLINSI